MLVSCTRQSDIKIFVYGSLREGFYNYDKYLAGKVNKIEIGTVQGKLFALEGLEYPALLPGTDTIIGEIMTLHKETEELLTRLDELECYYGENYLTNEYDKIITLVFNTVSKREELLPVYFYNTRNPKAKVSLLIPVIENDWKVYKKSLSIKDIFL